MGMEQAPPLVQVISWFIYLLPYFMGAVFGVALVLRALIYYTVKRHEWFATEFEKRVNKYVEDEKPAKHKSVSFYVLSKQLLERTFYESFELRDRMRRRGSDRIMSFQDRVFLIRQGCAWLVKDILKQIKFLKWTDDTPKLLNITKSTFQNNPCFNRVFGVIPIAGVNDLLSILPGLFVVAGILGTFLGIRGGIESLSQMSLENLDATKKIIDGFLSEIAFAMTTSIVGISFSLAMHVYNTIFSPERLYVAMIDRFESALDLLWYRSENNDYPDELRSRDPVELLAEETLNLEVLKNSRNRKLDEVRKSDAS